MMNRLTKVGRNTLCMCGSGKKYKKCCLNPPHPADTHVELTAFRSERVIITIQRGAIRYKVLQVFFGRDGSLFVNFPYFRHREGILGAATLPADAPATTAVNVVHCGKVASHLVKYSHHPDGRAHFSQDGKVRTEIKRQSVRLDEHGGHIFSVLIQGLPAFRTDVSVDIPPTPKRATINFDMNSVAEAPLDTFKIVGRWFNIADMQYSGVVQGKIGPIVPTQQPDGRQLNDFAIASPSENVQHFLLLTCESIASLGPE